MKSIIRKSVIAATLLFAATVTTFSAHAKNSRPIYDRSLNSAIGITVENATGAKFVIRNSKGNIVHEGRVKDNNRFYIPTQGLVKGTYHFVIGNTTLQEFVIR